MRSLASGLLVLSLLAVSCGAPSAAPPAEESPDVPATPAAPGGSEPAAETPPPPPPPVPPAKPDEPPPPPPPPATYAVETMTFGGEARVVGLSVPTAAPSSGVALVLAFHGDGGTGPGLRDALDIGALAKGEAVVAYPTSTQWGWDLTLPAEANKDIPWVEALVVSLSALHSIDPARVFAVGYSKGAFFADQLACTRSGLLRGVAVHAGGAPYDPEGRVGRYPNGYVQCDAAQTGTAALIVHGKDDWTVPFGSGEHATKYWAYVNGCGGEQAPWSLEPCVAQTACPEALPVTFCPVPGLDHGLWSRAAEVTWSFFTGL